MKAIEGAALVVSGTLAFGGRLAAMKHGLPWLSAVVQPKAFLSAYDVPEMAALKQVRRVRRFLGPHAAGVLLRREKRRTARVLEPEQRLRARVGLPPGAGVLFDDTFSPYGTVAFYSPLLGEVAPDFPPLTRVVGFPRYQHPGATLPPQLAAFLRAGPPPLVFSGTNLFHLDMKGFGADAFYGECIAAARALNRRAVLLTATDHAQIPAAPDVFVCPFVSHPLIFPHAEAVIHNGGIGTIYGALRAGKPQLNVPISVDQPDNARRVVRLGVAATVPYRRFSAQSAADALRRLLADPCVAQRCAELAPIVQREDGAAEAASIIEGLLTLSRAQIPAH